MVAVLLEEMKRVELLRTHTQPEAVRFREAQVVPAVWEVQVVPVEMVRLRVLVVQVVLLEQVAQVQ
jgi:hypothetical protein